MPDKKARPDLNLQDIDLKFAQIVAYYKAYHMKYFHLDTFNIKTIRSKMRNHKKKVIQRNVANYNIAQTISPLSILYG